MFEDFRGCSEYFEEDWIEEKELTMSIFEWCSMELWDMEII